MTASRPGPVVRPRGRTMLIMLLPWWCCCVVMVTAAMTFAAQIPNPPPDSVSLHKTDDEQQKQQQQPSAGEPSSSSSSSSVDGDAPDRRPSSDDAGTYANCDYFQNLVPNKSYDVYSPGYDTDSKYRSDTNCRWTAVAPSEHSILLDCIDVSMPTSYDCRADRLEISGAGLPDLMDAKRFCGVGSFVSESKSNKLVIALRSPRHSNGGRFRCSMSAVRLPVGTTQYCECGRKKMTRIVGGDTTSPNEYPMMAGLVQQSASSVYCGATIISRNFAVTAAHCVDPPIDQLGLLVGDQDYRIRNDTRFTALYRLSAKIIHPLYTQDTNLNDIALVRTTPAMTFNEGVGAVCLPFKYAFYQTSFEGSPVVATGWGTLEFGGPLSPTLQEVTLDVVSNQRCEAAFPGQITSAQICTFRQDKDTCQSDSGGPLFYTDTSNQLLYLVGTVAYGTGCASTTPSVNMRTTSYLAWIQANTAGTVFCYK